MSDSVRIRYSRVEKNRRWVKQGMDDEGRWVSDRAPKNTLATVRLGDLVFFGIARCNTKMDTFYRWMGTEIAMSRAEKAIEEMLGMPVENLTVHRSGLRGVVSAEDIPALLGYFDGIDRLSLNALNSAEEAEVLDVEAV